MAIASRPDAPASLYVPRLFGSILRIGRVCAQHSRPPLPLIGGMLRNPPAAGACPLNTKARLRPAFFFWCLRFRARENGGFWRAFRAAFAGRAAARVVCVPGVAALGAAVMGLKLACSGECCRYWVDYTAGAAGVKGVLTRSVPTQIGRASCRERV